MAFFFDQIADAFIELLIDIGVSEPSAQSATACFFEMGVTTAADLVRFNSILIRFNSASIRHQFDLICQASLEDGDLRKAGLNIVQTRKLRAAIEVGLTMLQFTNCVVTHLQLPYD